jgi:hypothetical protein
MFSVIFLIKGNPLMTTGDAVASFLDNRDDTTINTGLMSVKDTKKDYGTGANTWENRRWRWKDATSISRRIVTVILYAPPDSSRTISSHLARFTAAISTVLILLIWGVRNIKEKLSMENFNAYRLGFGAVDPRALIYAKGLPRDMIGLAVIANAPQIILSVLYYAFNGLFTAMLMGYEWTSYAHKKKGLRVSRQPAGSQRSTYFLSLPYRFGIPLVLLSGCLHWLVSQSIFVVAYDLYNDLGEVYKVTTEVEVYVMNRTIGYSPSAMVAVAVLGGVMVAAVVGFGFISYERGMPLAGSCSLAISAACHPEQGAEAADYLMSEQKLQWGVVSTGIDGIGHCAFSSAEVGPLVKGRMYA